MRQATKIAQRSSIRQLLTGPELSLDQCSVVEQSLKPHQLLRLLSSHPRARKYDDRQSCEDPQAQPETCATVEVTHRRPGVDATERLVGGEVEDCDRIHTDRLIELCLLDRLLNRVLPKLSVSNRIDPQDWWWSSEMPEFHSLIPLSLGWHSYNFGETF